MGYQKLKMTERTWRIQDQLPNGEWGPEYEVTLAEYLAKTKAAQAKAMAIFKSNVEATRRAK
jgi:hypothetical protein